MALALLAMLELTARVWLFGLAGLDPRRVDSVRPIGLSGFLRPSTTPGLSYELRPNLDGWLKLARFHTNSKGLRYREITLEKPEGALRVAVIGDSYAMPSGVELADSFHGRLEARFNARPGSRRIAFINFAVGGYLPHEFLATLRHKAFDYEPDLVLVSATARSVRQYMSRRPVGAFPYRPREPVHPFFHSFLRDLIRARSLRPENVRARRHAARPKHIPEEPLEFETVLEAMGHLSRREQVPIVIVRLETVDRPESPADQELRRQTEANGLFYVDTRSAFQGTDAHDFWIHPLDPHPNAAAQARFADVIERFLDAEGWLARDAATSNPADAAPETH